MPSATTAPRIIIPGTPLRTRETRFRANAASRDDLDVFGNGCAVRGSRRTVPSEADARTHPKTLSFLHPGGKAKPKHNPTSKIP